MIHYKSVDAYIAAQTEEAQRGLQKIRKAVTSAAPNAAEVISYGMPAIKQNGILVYYAVTKTHYGFYPTPGGIDAFAEELKPYEVGKGTVRFPLDQPLPLALIKEIVTFRVAQAAEQVATKKAAAKKKATAKKLTP